MPHGDSPSAPRSRQDAGLPLALCTNWTRGKASPKPSWAVLSGGAARGQRVLPSSGCRSTGGQAPHGDGHGKWPHSQAVGHGVRRVGAGSAPQHRRAMCPSPRVGIDWRSLPAAALCGILMPQLFISRLSSYVFKYRILRVYDKIKQHLLEN